VEKVEEIEDIKIGERWDGDSYSYGNLGLDRAQMAAQVLIGKHIIRRCPRSTTSCCVGLVIQSRAVEIWGREKPMRIWRRKKTATAHVKPTSASCTHITTFYHKNSLCVNNFTNNKDKADMDYRK
jgi:hypothetical protein